MKKGILKSGSPFLFLVFSGSGLENETTYLLL